MSDTFNLRESYSRSVTLTLSWLTYGGITNGLIAPTDIRFPTLEDVEYKDMFSLIIEFNCRQQRFK